MNIKEFQEKYPDLYQTIFDQGSIAGANDGRAEGEAAGLERGRAESQSDARAEGARVERERIQSVESQSMPGHEKLIQELKFDGQTTGEQAAVKILQAEKALRINMQAQMDADGIDPLAHISVQANAVDSTASVPEGPDKWKAEYEKSAEIQKEFKSLENYTAYKKGVSEGRVKIFGVREVK